MQYVFGYGSLMNPESLARTVEGNREMRPAHLRDFRRKFNKKGRQHLFLNIVPHENFSVDGVIIEVSDDDLERLKAREIGYDLVDVTAHLDEQVRGAVYTFIAPDEAHPDVKISRRYLEVCLAAIDQARHEQWIRDTVIEHEIEEDLREPRFKHVDSYFLKRQSIG